MLCALWLKFLTSFPTRIAADQLTEADDDKPLLDEHDSPLIVPPPGSILRRSARTKIRKNSLLGDGGGHRFGPSKRRSPYAGMSTVAGEEDAQDGSFAHEDSRRTVSVGSMASLESAEGDNADASFDTSRDLERETTPEPMRPARSPKRQQHFDESNAPIPPQYMAPSPAGPEERTAGETALTGQYTVTPGRAGADMPHIQTSSPSPPRPYSRSPPLDVHAHLPEQRSPQTPPTAIKSVEQMRQDAAEKLTASLVGATQSQSGGSVQSSRMAAAQVGLGTPPPQMLAAPPAGSSASYAPAMSAQSAPSHLENSPVLSSPSSTYRNDDRPVPPRKVSDDSLPLAQYQQRARSVSPQPATSSQSPITPPSGAPVPPPQNASRPPVQQQGDLRKPGPPSKASPQPSTPALAQSPPPALPKEHKEKKSTWARLGLSRGSSKDDSASDVDDSASIMSSSSASSGFSMAGAGKKGKKGKKETKHEPPALTTDPKKAYQQHAGIAHPEKEKEKAESTGGFFGGLFGSKKRPDSSAADGEKATLHAPGQAHLQLPTPPPTASGMLTADGKYVNFYRLPIHIERAVYRLSHIKLANPRRPLYEQVLISNLMFWYLGCVTLRVASACSDGTIDALVCRYD